MIALGQLGPVADIEIKIQNRVAKFLALKGPLLKLSRLHPVLSKRNDALRLYARQKVLETELANIFVLIKKIKTGAYTYGEVAEVAAFGYAFETHIRKADKLLEEGYAPEAVEPTKYGDLRLPTTVAVVAALGVLYYVFK